MINVRKFIIALLAIIFMAGAFSMLQSAWSQNRNMKQTQQQESFTRPAPSRPIVPVIPGADRYQEDKVFLEYADSLYRPANEYEEFQIVKGAVKFRHGGMWMFCDSAYYYPQKNSLDAFGHVEMQQGDTLFVFADKLYYDGMSRHAILTRGPSRGNVVLKNRNVTLTTDSLDYDLNSQLGWYTTGGKLEDEVNDLTSQYGEYSPATKIAKFRYDVILVNRRDGYRLITNELEYNTSTHIADINDQTRIEGANDTIITTRGTYNTLTDHAELTARSIILHRDSNQNVITLEGDSIIYDKLTRTSRAFMFGNYHKNPQPMILTDTARKVTLIGGYGEYNDITRLAYSTDYPLLIEYSRADTLFLRADTILSFIETYKPMRLVTRVDSVDVELPSAEDIKDEDANVDSLSLNTASILSKIGVEITDTIFDEPKDVHLAYAIGRGRFFNQQIQGIADTLIFREQDSMLYMLRKPVAWTGERQVYGNRINVHFNDSTADWAELPESGMLAEHVEEDFYQQLTGTHMMAYFSNQELDRLDVEGNVVAILLPQEKDSSYNKLVNAESSYLTLEMTGKEIKHLKMWPEVSGTVTPLFDIKQSQKYISGFKWLESLRPKRSWYGNQLRWIDELGDVPDDLDAYFREPPLFKVLTPPKRQLQ